MNMEPDNNTRTIEAYKLFRRRKDGTLGPLFINRKLVVETGRWHKAESHRTKGYAYRPGWHCTVIPHAPHLKVDAKSGQRVWVKVLIADFKEFKKPEHQGGTWLLANWLKVIG